MKPLRTWVLVADGARARILENNGPDHSLRGVEGLVFDANHDATHDIVSDRQGRSFSSHGDGCSAIEPRTDPHRELKAKFARHLASVLSQELANGAYSRLIIVAAPVTLGDLRSEISDQVKATLVGEIAHDLTKTPDHEVAKHLGILLFASTSS
eukprot:gene15311-15454_t